MHPNGNEASHDEFTTSSPLSSFVETARRVIFSPADFYRGIRPTGPLKNPVIFAVACGVISFPLGFFSAPLDPLAPDQPVFPQGLSSFATDNLWITVALVALGVVMLPLFALLGLYVGALIQHLFVVIFVRQRMGFESTLRVVAYASALSLFSWIPVIGYLVTPYGVYVYTMGLRELHSTSTTRALLAALVPILIWASFLLLSLLFPMTPASPG